LVSDGFFISNIISQEITFGSGPRLDADSPRVIEAGDDSAAEGGEPGKYGFFYIGFCDGQ
jgi:hypothetical protein